MHHHIEILPEFALHPRRFGSLGRKVGIIPVAVRVVLDDQLQLAFIFFQNLLDDRTDRLTIRSLKIYKFNHGYGGISRTTLRSVPERDFKPRLFCCRSRRHQQTEKQCGH